MFAARTLAILTIAGIACRQGVETHTALGLYRRRVGGHLTGTVDANQSSLVYHAVFNDSGLGYPPQRRTCTAVATRAAGKPRVPQS